MWGFSIYVSFLGYFFFNRIAPHFFMRKDMIEYISREGISKFPPRVSLPFMIITSIGLLQFEKLIAQDHFGQIFDRFFWGDKLTNITYVFIELSNIKVPFLNSKVIFSERLLFKLCQKA